MEPMHVHALLRLKVAEQERLEQLERYFAVRDHSRRVRRERVRRWSRRFVGRAPSPTRSVELAVQ